MRLLCMKETMVTYPEIFVWFGQNSFKVVLYDDQVCFRINVSGKPHGIFRYKCNRFQVVNFLVMNVLKSLHTNDNSELLYYYIDRVINQFPAHNKSI